MGEEYKQSGEGCFILEAQDKDGKLWCFDATRRLNQFGRYLNHAPGSMINTTPVPPVVVEGQLRVGFVATRQIEAREEVVWDYGVWGEPWLRRQGKNSLALELCSHELHYIVLTVKWLIPFHLSTFLTLLTSNEFNGRVNRFCFRAVLYSLTASKGIGENEGKVTLSHNGIIWPLSISWVHSLQTDAEEEEVREHHVPTCFNLDVSD